MKKILLFASAFLSFITVYGQNPALPNAGFENWTLVGSRYDPNNWNTLNPSTAILGVYTATRATGADVHTGSYALKLQTKNVFLTIANGIASTGTIITTAPYGVTGGIPYTGRPDSIVGWYKSAPAGTDSGFVQFMLQDSSTLDTIGYVRWQAKNVTVSTYTRFSAPITYYSSATPNLSNWILSSSRGSGPVVNSVLILDDLELIFNPIICAVPTGTVTLNITTVGAKLKWSAAAGSLTYQSRYRVVGTTAWTTKTGTGLNKVITGLLPGTTYEWQVRSKCSLTPVTWSLWTSKLSFTTLTAREANVQVEEESPFELTIFPNPSNNQVTVSMLAETDEIVKISVYNVIGQQMISKEALIMNGSLNEQLNVSQLNNGVYMIAVDSPGMHLTKKLLVQ